MNTINNVVIIGGGTMGAGIAQWFASRLVGVELVDTNIEVLDKAQKNIFQSWDTLTEKGKISSCQQNQYKKLIEFKMINQVRPSADFVIEAIIENLEIKKALFKSLDSYFSEKSVFASNTSSFLMKDLSSELSEKRKKNFLGLHFFNPATIMKLVEIITYAETNTEISTFLYDWFQGQGKEPAICKDSPGFIVNRVARNFYGEPLRILEKSNQDNQKNIDLILKEVGEFKMGPFELMDLIGIDVNLAVTKSVYEAFNKASRFAPHKIQIELVNQGLYGRKTKKGFYDY